MSALNPNYQDFFEARPALGRRVLAFVRGVPIGIWLAVVIALGFLVAAVAPGLIETQNPYSINLVDRLQSPSTAHLFGTDQLGRDNFSRVVAGTRQSLLIGFGATGLALLIALTLGLLAGMGGRWAMRASSAARS